MQDAAKRAGLACAVASAAWSGALGCEGWASLTGSSGRHWGLFLLVKLLTLITSLALLARS